MTKCYISLRRADRLLTSVGLTPLAHPAPTVMMVCGFVMAWQRFHNDPDMQAAE